MIRNALRRFLRTTGRSNCRSCARSGSNLATRAVIEIAALLHQLLKLYPNFVFAPDDIHVLIETPEKTFAEYVTHARAAETGRTLHQLFTGYLVAEAGEIKLLRETFNPLARRRRNCRMESPTSDHPVTRCILSEQQGSRA